MRRSVLFAVLVLSMICQAVVTAASPEQRFLRIASAGGVYKLTGNIAMPAKDSVHRLVIDATGSETTDAGINRHLESAARALNLYALAGVPNDKVEVAVVVHGKATPMVLSDDAFRRKFGKRNPDSVLIDDLSRAGVRSPSSRKVDRRLPANATKPDAPLGRIGFHQRDLYLIAKW